MEKQAILEASAKVEAVVEKPIAPPVVVQEKPVLVEFAFMVRATEDKIAKLERFLKEGGYDYV